MQVLEDVTQAKHHPNFTTNNSPRQTNYFG